MASNGSNKPKGLLWHLSNILTLSLPSRPFTILGIVAFVGILPVPFFEALPNVSVCARILGPHCYSVGITRGLSSLLKGQMSQAIAYNWLSIPVLIIMVSIILHDAFILHRRQRR